MPQQGQGQTLHIVGNDEVAPAYGGVRAGVTDARFVKPIDEALARRAAAAKLVVTLEENVLSGGLGERVMEFYAREALRTPVLPLGVPDRFVEHAQVERQIQSCGLDAMSVAQRVLSRVKG